MDEPCSLTLFGLSIAGADVEEGIVMLKAAVPESEGEEIAPGCNPTPVPVLLHPVASTATNNPNQYNFFILATLPYRVCFREPLITILTGS